MSYHHKWYGTYDTEIHRSKLSNPELTITFPIGASRERWIQQLKHDRTSTDRAMQDLMVRPHRRKARKRMAGKIMIAEMLITDAERIQWYLNTAGTKLRVPRRAIPRGLFFLLFRLRLIGYPVWRSLGSLAWCNVALMALIATIVYDHYFNEGQLLLRALLALGARRAE